MLAVDLVDWNASLGAGEFAVAVGTLALAGFTWRLARMTALLDEHTAARERVRKQRAVRRVARLVDGEFGIVEASLSAALNEGIWHRFYLTPHGAWNRDGALIAESLPQDEAQAVIDFVARLTAWEQMVVLQQTINFGFKLGAEQKETVTDLSSRLNGARPYVERVAYPDARDLELDPDNFAAYLRQRRGERRRRLSSALRPRRK